MELNWRSVDNDTPKDQWLLAWAEGFDVPESMVWNSNGSWSTMERLSVNPPGFWMPIPPNPYKQSNAQAQGDGAGDD